MNNSASKATCKVTDLGFAVKHDNEKLKLSLGTAPYMAPEIITFQKYDEKVDIWAIGVIAHELLFGKRPFNAVSTKQVLNVIKERKQ